MTDQLKKLLDFYENTINPDTVKNNIELHKKTLQFENTDQLCVNIGFPNPELKGYSMSEIHEDVEKMAYNEFLNVYAAITGVGHAIPMIRANYGVGILPSIFGVNSRIVSGNMPWVDHVGIDGVKEILSKGIPDYRNGFGQKMIDAYSYFSEVLSNYPKCKECIRLYQPDFQGAFDVAHLIWGSDIYMDMYDEPELLHEFLELISQTYVDSMKKICTLLNDNVDGYICQWGNIFPGNVLLRNDTAVNLSPSMYEEFVKPYDEKIFEAFGGGSMHFCGRADHWIFEMEKSKNIKGFNFGHMPTVQFGQEYLDFLRPNFYDKKRPVVQYLLERKDLETFDFSKYPTGVTFHVRAGSRNEAVEIYEKYFQKK